MADFERYEGDYLGTVIELREKCYEQGVEFHSLNALDRQWRKYSRARFSAGFINTGGKFDTGNGDDEVTYIEGFVEWLKDGSMIY